MDECIANLSEVKERGAHIRISGPSEAKERQDVFEATNANTELGLRLLLHTIQNDGGALTRRGTDEVPERNLHVIEFGKVDDFGSLKKQFDHTIIDHRLQDAP